MATERAELLTGIESEVEKGEIGAIIPGGARKRTRRYKDDEERWIPPPNSDWDPDQPYGGKVYLARFKQPDPWWIIGLQVLAVVFAVGLAYYSYYHFDHLHYTVTKGYAHLGYSVAQHQLGQKLLNGHGVDKDPHQAMEWFKLAADQGHPEASYNVAIGHLKGIRKDILAPGEPQKMIAHAAASGIPEAKLTLDEHCAFGRCD